MLKLSIQPLEVMMTINFTARFFVAALSISSIFLPTIQIGMSQTQPTQNTNATIFRCVSQQGGGYATIAQRGNRKTSPLITWKSTVFGPQFSPLQRCETVSERLTKAVAASGGRLNTLRMTHGMLNSYPVLCYIRNPRESCNNENILLTLNQSDRGKEPQILEQLMSFSVKGTGTPLTRDTDGRTIVYLGLGVEEALAQGDETPSPNSTTSVTQPQQSAPAP
jgi:hypothetical protein